MPSVLMLGGTILLCLLKLAHHIFIFILILIYSVFRYTIYIAPFLLCQFLMLILLDLSWWSANYIMTTWHPWDDMLFMYCFVRLLLCKMLACCTPLLQVQKSYIQQPPIRRHISQVDIISITPLKFQQKCLSWRPLIQRWGVFLFNVAYTVELYGTLIAVWGFPKPNIKNTPWQYYSNVCVERVV